MRPTSLQCASGTNYTRFERYLRLLGTRDLVRVTRDSRRARWITLTSPGRRVALILAEGIAILDGREDEPGRTEDRPLLRPRSGQSDWDSRVNLRP